VEDWTIENRALKNHEFHMHQIQAIRKQSGSGDAKEARTYFLYGISPTDPLSFSSTAVVLVLVALVASYIGARRAAAGVDPMIALGLCSAKGGGDSGIEEGSFRYC